MSIQKIVDGFVRSGTTATGSVPDTWSQGRTTYGGMTAMLCLMAAEQLAEGRSLRSASIGFVGPCSGELEISAEVIRAGRTAATVRAQLKSELGPGTEALFTFSTNRESVLSQPGERADIAPPDAFTPPVPPFPGGPGFTQNLEYVWVSEATPFSGHDSPSLRSWVRMRDPESREHPLSLLCLADALPPAVSASMTDRAPVSSMTWMLDFYDDKPTTENGWWLLDATSEFAQGGHSSQDMTIWNSRGECVAKGRQLITLFV